MGGGAEAESSAASRFGSSGGHGVEVDQPARALFSWWEGLGAADAWVVPVFFFVSLTFRRYDVCKGRRYIFHHDMAVR